MYYILSTILLMLFIAYADWNIKQEVVVRMFVELFWMYLDKAD
jgi:hypothetical protein